MYDWISKQLAIKIPQPFVTVLGSGPSLNKYQAEESFSIAVNGASLCAARYDLFVCGDAASPSKNWFYGSERFNSKRLVASFISPRDKIIFPEWHLRFLETLRLQPRIILAHLLQSHVPVYDFLPKSRAAAGNGWYQYVHEPLDIAIQNFEENLKRGRMLHGATISGVALQIAVCLGAKKIRTYGVSLDNNTGERYFRPGLTGAVTTDLQRKNFQILTDQVRKLGVEIEAIN